MGAPGRNTSTTTTEEQDSSTSRDHWCLPPKVMVDTSPPMQGQRGLLSHQPQDRFPIIAPRHEEPSRSATSSQSKGGRSVSARLPPRSRFGCWTCRTRKVKCDEARPKCTVSLYTLPPSQCLSASVMHKLARALCLIFCSNETSNIYSAPKSALRLLKHETNYI